VGDGDGRRESREEGGCPGVGRYLVVRKWEMSRVGRGKETESREPKEGEAGNRVSRWSEVMGGRQERRRMAARRSTEEVI
jgi:hypothetical protein